MQFKLKIIKTIIKETPQFRIVEILGICLKWRNLIKKVKIVFYEIMANDDIILEVIIHDVQPHGKINNK